MATISLGALDKRSPDKVIGIDVMEPTIWPHQARTPSDPTIIVRERFCYPKVAQSSV